MSESHETGGEEIRGGMRDVSARSLTIGAGVDLVLSVIGLWRRAGR